MADFPTLSKRPDFSIEPKTEDTTLHLKTTAGYDITRPVANYDRETWEVPYTGLKSDDRMLLKVFQRQIRVGGESFNWQNPQEAYDKYCVWEALHAYPAGYIVRPATVNGHSYVCATAGTSGASCSFSTAVNATFSDGTVVWKENTYQVYLTEPMTEKPNGNNGRWNITLRLRQV